MKKKIRFVVCVIFVFTSLISLYYLKKPKHEKYIHWNIALPTTMQSIYQKQDTGFHGDGLYYDVFKLEKADDVFKNYNTKKDSTIERKIIDSLEFLRVEESKYPDFKKTYYWRQFEKNHADTLWILYFPEELEVYSIQELS